MVNRNIIIAILVVAFMFFSRPTVETSNIFSDLSKIIDSGIVFGGEDILSKSTDVSAEFVRIIRMNGDKKDLGTKSLSSGTLQTTPETDYRFYFFFSSGPSATYYADVQDYTAPLLDSVDNVIGKSCQFDTSLTYATLDENDNVQSISGNIISLSTSEEKDIGIRIRVNSDKCYGTPDAPDENVVCFLYNSSAITQVKTQTKNSAIPVSISTNGNATGKAIQCNKFPLLTDGESIDLSVHIVGSSSTEPTTIHNITVMSDDIAFDLDGDDLSEIWGYVDERGNELASGAQLLGQIRIS